MAFPERAHNEVALGLWRNDTMLLGCIRTESEALYFRGEEPSQKAALLLLDEYDHSAYSFIALCRVLGLELAPPPEGEAVDWTITLCVGDPVVA